MRQFKIKILTNMYKYNIIVYEVLIVKFSDDDFNFREIINKLIIIKNKSIGENLSGNITNDNSDSILCYCYIDETAGISFEYLSNYLFEKDNIVNNLRKDTFYKFRFETVINDEFKMFSGNITGIKEIDEKINITCKHYDLNKDTNELRKYEIFDPFRVKGFPDDVEIYLIKEGLNTEKLYVKLFKIDGQKTYGKLLNEPYQNFGVHINEIIEIFIVKYKSGEIILLHQCGF
jgi:hypothetical protein